MSDDKRFDPTSARRRRAVAEGNVARSVEVTSLAAFGGATVAALLAVPLATAAAAAVIRHVALHPLDGISAAACGLLLCAALLPAAAAAAAASAVAIAQGGGLRVTAVHADVMRLNPLANLKRMAGGEALVAVLRATFALAAGLLAMLPLAREVIAGGAALRSPAAAASLVAFAGLRACLAAFAVGAAFAVADYALARRRWLRGLRMSLEEIKRDAKENEGDPHTRARRKRAHRAMSRGGISRVRDASFVVVNPTHVAVALRYAPPAIPVPEILVRVVDDAALRVRALAREHGIPVIEDVALARLLYAQGETGQAIPPDAYVAVAEIVAALARAGLAS